jgi:hypothetical protein
MPATKKKKVNLSSIFTNNSRPRVPVDPPPPSAAAVSVSEEKAESERVEEALDELVAVVNAPVAAEPRSPARKRKKLTLFQPTVPEPCCSDIDMRCVFENASQMAAVLKAMKGLEQQNIMIDLNPDTGFSIRLVHSGRTVHVYISVARERFSLWQVDRSRAYLVRFSELKAVCEATKQNHVLTFFTSQKNYPDRLCVRLYAPKCDRLCFLNLRNASNALALSRLPYQQWKYPLRVTMDTKAFADELKHCLLQKANSVEWSIDNEGRFVWRAFADKYENGAQTTRSIVEAESVERPNGPEAEQAQQSFSALFLSHIVAIGGTSALTHVHMGMRDMPAWLSFAVRDTTTDDESAPPAIVIDGILMPREDDAE